MDKPAPVKLHYQTYGAGPPVVILHGLFGSSRNWTTFARRLAERFFVITMDLRNHGASGHADRMTYPDMAADIRKVLDECRLQQASFIGHSLGGKVAMAFALVYPTMVKRLIVLDIAPLVYRNNFLPLLESLESLPLSELRGRKHADALLSTSITDRPLRQFLLTNLVKVDNSYRWRVNLAALKQNLSGISGFPDLETVDPYTGPALFLGGADSSYLRPEHTPVINRYFTDARIDHVENAGHWLHVDQPVQVLDRVMAFLRST